jgi:two-component system, NarL family, invasion response regulator UvrY
MSGVAAATQVEDRRAGVLAVDDHPSFIALLRDLVRATRRLQIVGEADCGERAVDLACELKPDLVLMDVRMPGLGGVEAGRRIKAALPSTVLIFISTTRPDELPSEVEQAGADATFWKSELHPDSLDEIWARRAGGGD